MSPYAIPARLNLVLWTATLAILLTILYMSSRATAKLELIGLAILYGVFMNTGYALIHEAEHGMLHPNRKLNDLCGVVLALFFPAPLHLIRQGHIGHHMRNRSDDEAFDFYFEHESRLWRWLQLYGTLTGFFWATIALSNCISAVAPGLLRKQITPFDRTTPALQESLNPKYELRIQLESYCCIPRAREPHCGLVSGDSQLRFRYLRLRIFVVRDAIRPSFRNRARCPARGAELGDVRPARPHLAQPQLAFEPPPASHHSLDSSTEAFSGREYEDRGSLLAAYFRMWRGPQFSPQRVQNRFAGRIIQ